ncbi:hypothetical protein D3C87_466030 [compost metagenome]
MQNKSSYRVPRSLPVIFGVIIFVVSVAASQMLAKVQEKQAAQSHTAQVHDSLAKAEAQLTELALQIKAGKLPASSQAASMVESMASAHPGRENEAQGYLLNFTEHSHTLAAIRSMHRYAARQLAIIEREERDRTDVSQLLEFRKDNLLKTSQRILMLTDPAFYGELLLKDLELLLKTAK